MILFFLSFILSVQSFEPKERFVKAVMEQCKLEKEEAIKLATAGRNGTVVRFELCMEKVITLENECQVYCEKEGVEL